MKVNITFNKSAKKFVLASFNKALDSENFIIEKDNPTQRVLSLDGQPVKLDEFAGIKKGSEIFVKSDLVSLIQLCDALSNKNGSS